MSVNANPTRSSKSVLYKFRERTFGRSPLGPGSYAWLFHRITGIVLALYLILHLFVLGTVLQGGDSFNQIMTTLENPVAKVFETLLIWVAVFHTTNGLRLVVLDLAPSVNQRFLIYGALAATVLLSLIVTLFIW